MTAAEALQAAVQLLAQARVAADNQDHQLALVLSSEAAGWALIANAIESGVPAPDAVPGGDWRA